MHKDLPFDPNKLKRRRKHTVVNTKRFHTAFAKRQYMSQSAYIYNKVNKRLDIYHRSAHNCKEIVVEWLKTLSYEETENILKRIV